MPLRTYGKPLKTYKNSQAESVFDKLFEKNRNLSQSSTVLNKNDTFDNLLDGTTYRSVEYTQNISKILRDSFNNSDSLINKSEDPKSNRNNSKNSSETTKKPAKLNKKSTEPAKKLPKIQKKGITKKPVKKKVFENLKNSLRLLNYEDLDQICDKVPSKVKLRSGKSGSSVNTTRSSINLAPSGLRVTRGSKKGTQNVTLGVHSFEMSQNSLNVSQNSINLGQNDPSWVHSSPNLATSGQRLTRSRKRTHNGHSGANSPKSQNGSNLGQNSPNLAPNSQRTTRNSKNGTNSPKRKNTRSTKPNVSNRGESSFEQFLDGCDKENLPYNPNQSQDSTRASKISINEFRRSKLPLIPKKMPSVAPMTPKEFFDKRAPLKNNSNSLTEPNSLLNLLNSTSKDPNNPKEHLGTNKTQNESILDIAPKDKKTSTVPKKGSITSKKTKDAKTTKEKDGTNEKTKKVPLKNSFRVKLSQKGTKTKTQTKTTKGSKTENETKVPQVSKSTKGSKGTKKSKNGSKKAQNQGDCENISENHEGVTKNGSLSKVAQKSKISTRKSKGTKTHQNGSKTTQNKEEYKNSVGATQNGANLTHVFLGSKIGTMGSKGTKTFPNSSKTSQNGSKTAQTQENCSNISKNRDLVPDFDQDLSLAPKLNPVQPSIIEILDDSEINMSLIKKGKIGPQSLIFEDQLANENSFPSAFLTTENSGFKDKDTHLKVQNLLFKKFMASTPLKFSGKSDVCKKNDVQFNIECGTPANNIGASVSSLKLDDISKQDVSNCVVTTPFKVANPSETPRESESPFKNVSPMVQATNYVNVRKRRQPAVKIQTNLDNFVEKIVLPPGKKYRRTLFAFQNNERSFLEELELETPVKRTRQYKSCFEKKPDCRRTCRISQYNVKKSRRSTIKIVKAARNHDENLKINLAKSTPIKKTKTHTKIPGAESVNSNTTSESFNEKRESKESIFNEFAKLSLNLINEEKTPKDIVLEYCKQTEPILFDEIYSERSLQKCRKIGEGVYGEVFMFKHVLTDQCIVMKIIPIQGSKLVNGEPQKKYDEILSEIIISKKLSDLRFNHNGNKTDCFVELIKVSLVYGRYPSHLIDLWDLYDEINGSENDSPIIFDSDQLYIVLELGNGGQDLEAFHFQNAQQAHSLFEQLTLTLAIAEKEYKFEHRDLHWGNILISKTEQEEIEFILENKRFKVETNGIKITIIDFTLSRITLENDIIIFNDLKYDPDLFLATGDYQFDIYRLMQKNLDNIWENFDGKNNVLWLDYILDKLIKQCYYLNKNSKNHKSFMKKLQKLRKNLKNFDSVFDFLLNCVYLSFKD